MSHLLVDFKSTFFKISYYEKKITKIFTNLRSEMTNVRYKINNYFAIYNKKFEFISSNNIKPTINLI